MRNADPLDNTSLAYSFSSNGQVFSLAAQAAFAENAASTDMTGARYHLAFTMLPFAELPTEGTYIDTLTLTVSAP